MYARAITGIPCVVAIGTVTIFPALPQPTVAGQAHAAAAVREAQNGECGRDRRVGAVGDDYGTRPASENERAPQVAAAQHVAGHGSFSTERQGFEPW